MHLVVAEERVEETISGLHELFFREADPGVFD
jgi:hypothetical protein